MPKTRKEIEEGSPFRMQIDGLSPGNLPSPLSHRPGGQPRSVSDSVAPLPGGSPSSSCSPNSSQEGAQEILQDLFDEESPLPSTRKRLLDQENSPTPASPTPAGVSASGSLSRRFEKTNTLGGPIHVARRQRSSLGLNRRASQANFGTVSGSLTSSASILSDASTSISSSSTSSSFNKRLATQAQDGRPSHSRRNSRRALSVADAASAVGFDVQHSPASFGGGVFERDLNTPMESPQPAPIPIDRSDYFAGSGSGKRLGASIDLGPAVKACMSPDRGSPIAGFCQQEARGKALPCFYVKEDGLMRITPETVRSVHYDLRVACD